MRAAARVLLILFAFCIPWEYSLDFAPPWGNIARLAGLTSLLVAIPAILQAGRTRAPGLLQWLSLLLFAWLCATYFWSIEPEVTLARLPGYLQELMIVWLVGEFVQSKDELCNILRAWLAGCAVLAGLTLGAAAALHSVDQTRFFAAGQDPNDTARFLALGLPIAVLLAEWSEKAWSRRLMLLYLPLGIVAIIATASRGGFITMLVALAGSGALMVRNRRIHSARALVVTAVVVTVGFLVIPRGSFVRIATIPEQLNGGGLNQRMSIWREGWRTFQQAPFLGHGAGTFVAAAGLAPIDTAHNTALSVLVEGGIAGLAIGIAVVGCCVTMACAVRGELRIALLSMLAAWAVASFVGTTGESRTTWLLFAVIAVAARLRQAGAGAHAEFSAVNRLASAGAGS